MTVQKHLLLHRIAVAEGEITLGAHLLRELLAEAAEEARIATDDLETEYQKGFDEGYRIGMQDCQEHHPQDDRD